jgi:hypothetical protein
LWAVESFGGKSYFVSNASLDGADLDELATAPITLLTAGMIVSIDRRRILT